MIHLKPSRRTPYLAALAALGLVAGLAANLASANPTTQPSEAPKAVNTKCPIEPEHDIDPAATYTFDFEGKQTTVGFCCKGCIKPFKKDPAKYMKDLK
jgi:hypothetical protein